RRDPMRALRGAGAAVGTRDDITVGQAQQSEVDNAITAFADTVGSGLTAWWRLVTAWQWLLTVLAVAGVVLSLVIAVARLAGQHQGWTSEASLIPWLLVMTVAMLVLGYVTAMSCRNMAVTTAERERQDAERAMRARVTGVTHDLVLVATGRE